MDATDIGLLVVVLVASIGLGYYVARCVKTRITKKHSVDRVNDTVKRVVRLQAELETMSKERRKDDE